MSTPDVVLNRRRALPVIAGLAIMLAGCPGRDAPPEPNAPPRVLRVCADPNNLPFSNARGQGLENRPPPCWPATCTPASGTRGGHNGGASSATR